MIESHRDSFTLGESNRPARELSKAAGEAKIALIRRCERPWDKRCRCAAHQEYFGGWLDYRAGRPAAGKIVRSKGALCHNAFVRRYEWVIAGYFTYTATVVWLLPVRHTLALVTVVLNVTILAGLALLAYADSLRRGLFLGVARDWFPFPLTLLAYREMGWFAQPHYGYRLEQAWVRWDRLLLDGWGLHRAIESLGVVLPSILEISYALVYALGPFAVAMLYVYGRRERADRFLFPFLLAVLLCYAQFPLWPSEPPRTVFPGEDFPSVNTIFRRFNWWMLGGYGIHTSVFPSAHVAGAFSAAWGMMRALPEHAWVGRFLLAMAVLIATATVYGRYHYAADGLAGFTISLIALAVTHRLERARA